MYLSDEAAAGVRSLYFVDLSGSEPSAPVRLSFGTDVTFVQASANGSRVLFREAPSNPCCSELYVVDLTLSQLSAVSLGQVRPPELREFVADISYDGKHIAFRRTNTNENELMYSYFDGAAPTSPVSVNGSQGFGVRDFYFAHDGASLSYVAARDVMGVYDLWFVPIANGVPSAPSKVNGPHPDNGTIGGVTNLYYGNRSVFYSDDGAYLIYRVEHGSAGATYFSTDLRGGTPTAPIKLNGESIEGEAYDRWSIARGRRGFQYVLDQTIESKRELWFVDMSNPAAPAAALQADIPPGVVGGVEAVTFSDDGNRLVYLADSRSFGIFELFTTDVSTGVPQNGARISGSLAIGGDVQGFQPGELAFVRGSEGVLYRADQDIDGVVELYLANLSGTTAARKVHPGLAAGDHVEPDATVTGDGDGVLYRAAIDAVTQLWFAPIDGIVPATPRRVNPTLAAGGSVAQYWIIRTTP